MTAELERRYRRLLAWYPVDHRREYAEEMLSVLMAGATERQRRPAPREVANLLVTATWLRLKVGRTGGTRSRGPWADAVAVLALLAPVLLVGEYLRPVITAIGWRVGFGWSDPVLSYPLTWWRIAAWAVVAVALGYGARQGWRRLATVVAWIAAVGEVILTGRDDPYPAAYLETRGALLLALVAAALVTFAHGRAAALLGRSGMVWFAASATAGAMTAVAASLFMHGDESWPFMVQYGYTLVTAVGWGLVVLFTVLGVRRTPARVRRRALTILAPTITVLGLLPFELSPRLFSVATVPRLLGDQLQLALLVIAPLLAFAIALFIVQRQERAAVAATE